MRHPLALLLAGVLALAAHGGLAAQDGSALTASNFVAVGDRLADVLLNSGLAFATMVHRTAGTDGAAPRRVAFLPPAPPPQRSDSPCPDGGSVKVAMHDVDGNGSFSVHDRFVTDFESCRMDGSVVSGRSEFIVAAHRFDGHVEVTELEFRFKDLGTPELRWSGPARVVTRSDLRRGTEHHVVRYRALQVKRHGRSMVWSFALDIVRPPIGEQVARLDGALAIEGLRLQLRQDEPFVIAREGFPRAGQLSAQDPAGARIELEAGRRRYTYRFFRAGNTSDFRPDATSRSRRYGEAATAGD